MPLPHDIDRHLSGNFRHGLCTSVCLNPCKACTFSCCMPCYLYQQREEILSITGESYKLCGGMFQCCGLDTEMPHICLCAEVLWCGIFALSANRFLVQTRLNRRNSSLDNCCTIFHCCTTLQFACLRCCFDCSSESENLAKSASVFYVCTHCQNQAEIDDYRNQRVPFTAPPVGVIQELPVHCANAGYRLADAPTQQRLM